MVLGSRLITGCVAILVALPISAFAGDSRTRNVIVPQSPASGLRAFAEEEDEDYDGPRSSDRWRNDREYSSAARRKAIRRRATQAQYQQRSAPMEIIEEEVPPPGAMMVPSD